MKKKFEFSERGCCEVEGFDIILSGVNDKMVRAFATLLALRGCSGEHSSEREPQDKLHQEIGVNPACGHVPSLEELESFDFSCRSWSIPEDGMFILRQSSKALAVKVCSINCNNNSYSVELDCNLLTL